MDFSELSDEDLWIQMQDDLYDGLKDEVVAETREALARGYSAQDVLAEGLVAGMDIVGVDFRDGILFVPEVLMAANAMKGGMEILRPLLAETGAARIGTMVIGTVKGDIHDIGKNLVTMMMEGAGFEVINLGINNDAEKFINAVKQHQPDIVGMSALLTTTMPYMKVVILCDGWWGSRNRSLRQTGWGGRLRPGCGGRGRARQRVYVYSSWRRSGGLIRA
jgi:methanogenic corrinoid protein MtbC1